MKICIKCKNVYKNDYIFCPKCGTPYDEKIKKPKIPKIINGCNKNIVEKIVNIFLYIIGSLLILSVLMIFDKSATGKIIIILFALSLFPIFYKIIGDICNIIDEKYLKIARVIVPIIIFILCIINFYSIPNDHQSNLSNKQNTEIIENSGKSENSSQIQDQEINATDNVKEESTNEDVIIPINYDLEIEIQQLTEYYYDNGYKQGNLTYFGKKVKTAATFNSSDNKWPKSIYMDTPSGSHYRIACNSFKEDSFKKMSSKSVGEDISFIGKVDELISADNYKSGILTFEDCEILE